MGSFVLSIVGVSVMGDFVKGIGACDGARDNGILVDGDNVVGSEVKVVGRCVGTVRGGGVGSCVFGFRVGIFIGLDVGSSVLVRVGSAVMGNLVAGTSVVGSIVGKSGDGICVLDGFVGLDCGSVVGVVVFSFGR